MSFGGCRIMMPFTFLNDYLRMASFSNQLEIIAHVKFGLVPS